MTAADQHVLIASKFPLEMLQGVQLSGPHGCCSHPLGATDLPASDWTFPFCANDFSFSLVPEHDEHFSSLEAEMYLFLGLCVLGMHTLNLSTHITMVLFSKTKLTAFLYKMY